MGQGERAADALSHLIVVRSGLRFALHAYQSRCIEFESARDESATLVQCGIFLLVVCVSVRARARVCVIPHSCLCKPQRSSFHHLLH